MEKPNHHIFVCSSFRSSGEPQGVCHKKGAANFLSYIEGELSDRGMTDVVVSSTGCLKACDRGPIMVIYPENYWYGGVESEDIIDEILDSLEDGKAAEDYLLT
ncbi:MAG: (2Fe-2S) ferredoxin domain-containing protein [Spirochaetes bacterium]|nr:(2Fe-2S) ferredoxin domain-containing protein [Spirochaetota bacterium]